jgi:hypothetical protein
MKTLIATLTLAALIIGLDFTPQVIRATTLLGSSTIMIPCHPAIARNQQRGLPSAWGSAADITSHLANVRFATKATR